MPKQIAILGATGSVGTQALDVVRAHQYHIPLVSAGKNIRSLEKIVREFSVERAVVQDEDGARALRLALADTPCRVYSGDDGLLAAIDDTGRDTTYLNAVLGAAGLLPSLRVIDMGARLALANKETLVTAGEIVMRRLSESQTELIPVDSEHSAIFQCLHAGNTKEIRRILLTASGGPFYGYTREQLKNASLSDALAHPTWNMGAKITVDSATMMNKGFEMIEAVHLFSVDIEKVDVIVHRESIIHSAVEYIDNTVIAELSVPDMRACVQYAVDYPERKCATISPLDLFSVGKLTFSPPDENTFTPLALAREAAKGGGALGAVLNAADEIAVGAHLRNELSFSDIFTVLEGTFAHFETSAKDAKGLDDILLCDSEVREYTSRLIKNEFSAKR